MDKVLISPHGLLGIFVKGVSLWKKIHLNFIKGVSLCKNSNKKTFFQIRKFKKKLFSKIYNEKEKSSSGTGQYQPSAGFRLVIAHAPPGWRQRLSVDQVCIFDDVTSHRTKYRPSSEHLRTSISLLNAVEIVDQKKVFSLRKFW